MAQLISGTVDTQKSSYRSIGQVNAADDLELELEVKMNGQPIQFVAPQAELLIKKSDNNIIRQTKDILYQDGKFKIKVDEQGVTYPGIVTNQLVINDEGRVSTCLFYFMVGTSLDREVLQSISKVEVLEHLDEYVAIAFANLEEYEKRILSSDETIRKLNDDMNEAEKIRETAELQRQETFKSLKENMNEAITNLESSINLSNLNEKERSEVFNSLKSDLESIKQDLINLNTNISLEEEKRVQAEINRVNKALEIIEKLESTNNSVATDEAERVTEFNDIKSELTSLKEALTTINNTANSNEEVRKTNENKRIAAEQQRVTDFEKIKSDNTSLGTALTKKVDDKIVEIETNNNTFKQEINEQYEDIITKNTEFKEQMNTDFGNAKTDYFGEEHLNVVDRLNSDFDNVHQRINDSSYLEYSGSNIKADNTYYGLTKELSVKGRTLQNLCSTNNTMTGTPNLSTIFFYNNLSVPWKINTTYTFIFTLTKDCTGDISFRGKNNVPITGVTSYSFKAGINKCTLIATVGAYDEEGVTAYVALRTGAEELTISNFMVLEGDYTNVDFPINYFEGITSVGESEVTEEGKYKISGKSCGKNLFKFLKFKESIESINGLKGVTFEENKIIFEPNSTAISNNVFFKTNFKENTQYTLTYDFESNTDTVTTRFFQFVYTDGTSTSSYPRGSVKVTLTSTAGKTVKYITLSYGVTDYEVIMANIQLEEGTVATDHEPYQESNFELLLDEPLRSLPNGVADEITEDGEEIRRVGKVVLDGNRDWKTTLNLDGLTYRYSYEFNFKTSDNQNNINNIFCNNLVTKNFPDIYNNGKKGITTWWSNDYIKKNIVVCLSNDYSLEQFKQWLNDNPITVYYELAEPVVTKHNKNINLKTFAGTTHITSDNYLPPTLSCKIPSNVQAIVTSLMEENEELNNTISVMSLENEEKNLENIETNLDQDVRLTMLELGVI